MNIFKKLYKLGELQLEKQHNTENMNKNPLIDLFWECTLTCNAKCKHCGSSAENKKYRDELTTEEIKNGFKQIAEDMDATKILINVTGGEPLVRKDLFEVMEYATNELGFKWGMTTNGYLLTEENIKKLEKANLETVSISIDGLKNTHNNFRGLESYDIIMNNIKSLKAANYLKKLQVTTVVTKANINELEDLYNELRDLNIDSWRLMSMDPIGRANDNSELLLGKEEHIKLLDFIKQKNVKNPKKFALTYGCHSFLGLEYEKEVRVQYYKCVTGVNIASILYNGDLFVCPNVPRIKNLIQGNIKKDNFKQVWETKYKEFRDSKRKSCENCDKCEFWENCLGGGFHTWNFEESIQNKCIYNIIK